MPHRPRPGPAHHLERVRRTLVRTIGNEIVRLREDAGIPSAVLARAASISPAQMSRIERGLTTPSLPTMLAISDALGADLSVRLYPNTGPAIRDRHQAAILEALLRGLDRRWRPAPEVPVRSPVRGVVDAVLYDPGPPVAVATEVHSDLRRLEQQLRWHAEKAAALPSSDLWTFLAPSGRPVISRLLVLRSTSTTRALARSFEATLAAAYPARHSDALGSLFGTRVWPGDSLLWAEVEAGVARILEKPPRGVHLGP